MSNPLKQLDEDIEAKEKAKQLRILFFILPDELPVVGGLTFQEMGSLASIEAIAAVNILINERKRRPASFWEKVKTELQNYKP